MLEAVRRGIFFQRFQRLAGAAAPMAALLALSCTAHVAAPAPPGTAQVPGRTHAAAVDGSTMDRKLLFGYQGWFGCPEDGSPLRRWEHWFGPGPAPGGSSLRVDMWPDVSEVPPGARCATPLGLPDGRVAEVYSAYVPAAVDVHFRWLADYGLPGVLLRRFTARLDDAAMLTFRDAVARNVRAGAEAHGRVFAVMYDISGHQASTLVRDIARDWKHLVDTLRLTSSDRYLRHAGRPLVAIWGFGFRDRPGAPEQAAELIAFFRGNPEPRYRATVLGGVPAGWRTLTRDSRTDAAWASVYRSYDAISPWTVGRFRDDAGARRYYAEHAGPDLDEARRHGIAYMPVLFPGFSWHNMNPGAPLNEIPRRGGRFFWSQVEQAVAAGNTMLYAAMFDEVDEGTAMFKVAADAAGAPTGAPGVTLDMDGVPVPADWYLRLAREAQLKLRP
jgi:hypothetical protein